MKLHLFIFIFCFRNYIYINNILFIYQIITIKRVKMIRINNNINLDFNKIWRNKRYNKLAIFFFKLEINDIIN